VLPSLSPENIAQILSLMVQQPVKENKTKQNPPDSVVTKRTAANMLDVSVRQVERYIEQGLLTKMVRGANRVVVMRSEVEALVAGWRS
jgi:hypothetical protein